jgi:hypothetical protein
MLKTIITFLGWVPGLGESLKIAYIANCAREVAIKVKIDESKANLNGEELEAHISEMATSAYEEHLLEEVNKLGLPEFATNKASEKAIEIISSKIREKYQHKVASA